MNICFSMNVRVKASLQLGLNWSPNLHLQLVQGSLTNSVHGAFVIWFLVWKVLQRDVVNDNLSYLSWMIKRKRFDSKTLEQILQEADAILLLFLTLLVIEQRIGSKSQNNEQWWLFNTICLRRGLTHSCCLFWLSLWSNKKMAENSKQLLSNTICLRRGLMPSCRLSWLSLWPHLIPSRNNRHFLATLLHFWPF